MLFTAHHQLLARNRFGYAVERISKKQQNNLVEAVNLTTLFFFSAFTATMHRPPQNEHSTYTSESRWGPLPAHFLVKLEEALYGDLFTVVNQ